MPPFSRFVKNPYMGRTISLDPGETTGYAIWDAQKLVEAGQLRTPVVADSVKPMQEWFRAKRVSSPTNDVYVAMEEYRIYGYLSDSHSWSTVHTLRLIGCFETLLRLEGIGYETRGAGLAKSIATDEKLKSWDMWQTGQRHARDAIRHGIYFYIHGKDPFR